MRYGSQQRVTIKPSQDSYDRTVRLDGKVIGYVMERRGTIFWDFYSEDPLFEKISGTSLNNVADMLTEKGGGIPIPALCHKCHGKYYFSRPHETAEQYKLLVKTAYGDLRGVKFFELGKDYDSVIQIGDHFHPVKGNHYI